MRRNSRSQDPYEALRYLREHRHEESAWVRAFTAAERSGLKLVVTRVGHSWREDYDVLGVDHADPANGTFWRIVLRLQREPNILPGMIPESIPFMAPQYWGGPYEISLQARYPLENPPPRRDPHQELWQAMANVRARPADAEAWARVLAAAYRLELGLFLMIGPDQIERIVGFGHELPSYWTEPGLWLENASLGPALVKLSTIAALMADGARFYTRPPWRENPPRQDPHQEVHLALNQVSATPGDPGSWTRALVATGRAGLGLYLVLGKRSILYAQEYAQEERVLRLDRLSGRGDSERTGLGLWLENQSHGLGDALVALTTISALMASGATLKTRPAPPLHWPNPPMSSDQALRQAARVLKDESWRLPAFLEDAGTGIKLTLMVNYDDGGEDQQWAGSVEDWLKHLEEHAADADLDVDEEGYEGLGWTVTSWDLTYGKILIGGYNEHELMAPYDDSMAYLKHNRQLP